MRFLFYFVIVVSLGFFSNVLFAQANTVIEPVALSFVDNHALSNDALAKQTKKKYKRRGGFPRSIHTGGRNTFIFSPRMKAWAAYNKSGRLIRSGRASGGKSYCRDVGRSCLTPRGNFTVYSKGSRHCRSSKYPLGRGGARMDYCMFFRGGYAIHGSSNVPNYNASHGCIRVLPGAARWLNRSFLHIGAKVRVWSY